MATVSYLKASTATTLLLGPFVDATDGVTAETALTISQADVLLWKEGGTTLAQKNEATSCTHRSNGLYTCPVNTTDTNTVGVLTVSVAESGALPVRQDYLVLAANVYDSLIAASDKLQVDTDEIDGSANAATNQMRMAVAATVGTVTNAGISPTLTLFECSDVTEATADHYIGLEVRAVTGNLAGQVLGHVTDYALTSGRGRFTISPGSPAGESVANGDIVVFV